MLLSILGRSTSKATRVKQIDFVPALGDYQPAECYSRLIIRAPSSEDCSAARRRRSLIDASNAPSDMGGLLFPDLCRRETAVRQG